TYRSQTRTSRRSSADRLDPRARSGYTFVIPEGDDARAPPTTPEQADRRVQGRARAGGLARRDAEQERVHSQRRGEAALHGVPAVSRHGHHAARRRDRRAHAPRAAASALRLRRLRHEGPAPVPHAGSLRRGAAHRVVRAVGHLLLRGVRPEHRVLRRLSPRARQGRVAEEARLRDVPRGLTALNAKPATLARTSWDGRSRLAVASASFTFS